ncbi:GNAT family N-acetyltransferase [Paenibacillus sp. FSL R5-0923]|uniref:GNAT family N-acetyltransferase n=1 Tax=Paenibacillus sp. FSL R5-0923 TaxID=2921666 RepID=UPI0030FC8A25
MQKSLSDDTLTLFFEKLFDHFPSKPTSLRMVALQEGAVIGTISIKWKSESDMNHKQKLSSWKNFNRFGKWNLLKMKIRVHLFEYNPQVGEYNISDVTINPDHRGERVGKLLLQWAQHFVQSEPSSNMLCLHVSGENPGPSINTTNLHSILIYRKIG